MDISEDTIGKLWLIATVTIFVPLGVWLFVRDRQRQRDVVSEWAAANHVTLVRRLPVWYRVSPFELTLFLGSNQHVEYWIVKDAVGLERRVWFKIGNFFLGATRELMAEWES